MSDRSKYYKLNYFSCQMVNNGFVVTLGFQNRNNPDDVITEMYVHHTPIEARASFEQWLKDSEAFQ